jgi:hypothetical protein
MSPELLRAFASASLSIAIAALLTACGGGNDTEADTAAAQGDTGATITAEAAIPAPGTGGAGDVTDLYPDMREQFAASAPTDAQASAEPVEMAAADAGTAGDDEDRTAHTLAASTDATLMNLSGPGTTPTTTGTANIGWVAPKTQANGSTVGTLTGYRVYYGTASGKYTASVLVSGATASAATVSSLAAGKWYFTVSAIDSSGNESNLGYEMSKTL